VISCRMQMVVTTFKTRTGLMREDGNLAEVTSTSGDGWVQAIVDQVCDWSLRPCDDVQ
jgi:hypothetical protein